MRETLLARLGVGLLAVVPLASAAPALAAKAIPAAPAQVRETSLPATLELNGGIALGPGETPWVGALKIPPPGDLGPFPSELVRVPPQGQRTEYPTSGEFGLSELTTGPEGNIWFADPEVHSIDAGGAISNYHARLGELGGDMTTGPDGNLWFTRSEPGQRSSVVRMTLTGQVAAYPLPTPESRPGEIVAGPDQSLWFVEAGSSKIGRITTDGALTEYALPPLSNPAGITVGPDGNVWFTQGREKSLGSGAMPIIGRITPAGKITEFHVPGGAFVGQISTGADGRIWFIEYGRAALGRITPGGLFSEVELPDRKSRPMFLIGGAAGIFYAASGEEGCKGGSSCFGYIPKQGPIVGSVAPAPLAIRVRASRARLHHGRAKLKLGCQGGAATDSCRGRLVLERHGLVVARGRYALRADKEKLVDAVLTARGRALLHGRSRTPVVARAIGSKGKGASSAVQIRG